ncbi:acyltransferase family protein [Spirochaeta cellobiosiphila]|uniref:acyltransferase family protein n=1 Tax=Spirochaeta cellobiosiphila TaxID=504483 RepID=UPI0003F695AA|nr:acyltransferase family protein [Spirochaeta cellobiosiphila]
MSKRKEYSDNHIIWIDNAKAIGIILVMVGHLNFPKEIIIWLYSFHMPLFFFISGILAKSGKEHSIFKFIKNRAERLLVPYFMFALFSYLFWLLIGRRFGADSSLDINLLKPLLGILYSNGINNWLIFNAPLWFLTCLFITEIEFFMISKLTRVRMLIVLLLMITLGFLLSKNQIIRLPWGFNISLVSISFYAIGYYSKFLLEFNIKKSTALLLFILTLVVNIKLSSINGRIDMNGNYYSNIGLFYLNAILGILSVYFISKLINKNKLTLFIGKNTLVIMALHIIIYSFLKGIMVFILRLNYTILDGSIVYNLIFVSIALIFLCVISLFLNAFFPLAIGKKQRFK